MLWLIKGFVPSRFGYLWWNKLLIGFDFYWSVVTGKRKTGKKKESVAAESKFGSVLNRPVTSFEASRNLIFESDHLHVLFLNTDRSVINKNINFNANCFWDLETIGIHEKENPILRMMKQIRNCPLKNLMKFAR